MLCWDPVTLLKTMRRGNPTLLSFPIAFQVGGLLFFQSHIQWDLNAHCGWRYAAKLKQICKSAKNVLFLDLGTCYTDKFNLWKFHKLYTHVLCTFLSVRYTSLKKENKAVVLHWIMQLNCWNSPPFCHLPLVPTPPSFPNQHTVSGGKW